jgi:hypothetical protein
VEQLELGQHAFAYYDDDEVRWEVVEAMRTGHPVALLGRPGQLRAYRSDQGCHLIGDAGCAADLLRLGAASGCQQVVVRCSAVQARLLRRLGVGSLSWLVLECPADASWRAPGRRQSVLGRDPYTTIRSL